jgi:hypothetical protein
LRSRRNLQYLGALMEITRAEMLSLPRPTRPQIDAFGDYLLRAHSWYKASLFAGEGFVVFLAENAGGNGTIEKPLEYGKWKIAEEYRRHFGCLDYMWSRGPDGAFRSRDIPNSPVSLPKALVEQCSFTLFPWGAGDGAGLDVICGGYHAEDWEKLESGDYHPVRHQLLCLRRHYESVEALWQGLSDEEREIACEVEDESDERLAKYPEMLHWFHENNALWNAYSALGTEEVLKVKSALANLQQWLYGDSGSVG